MSEINKEPLWTQICQPRYLTLIILGVGFTIIGIHVWYENTTRSENWIRELEVETVCERIDNAISWGDHPFTERMVKFAEQRKQELKCP